MLRIYVLLLLFLNGLAPSFTYYGFLANSHREQSPVKGSIVHQWFSERAFLSASDNW